MKIAEVNHTPNLEKNHEKKTDWMSPRFRGFNEETLGRYSRFVDAMKVFLPLLAAVILLVLVILPSVIAPHSEQKIAASIDATMTDAHYTSRDAQNRPYDVKADKARQDPGKPDMTSMSNPTATLDLGNGKTLNATGNDAEYNQKNGQLSVKGDVVLQHSDGTIFKTQDAVVDVNNKNASGNKPATLTGAFGEVRGEGFKTMDGGKTVIFTGQTSATIKLGTPTQSPAALPDSSDTKKNKEPK
jgi:lipopolysaccharide export system protein LptC